jgi:catechol 2,3-dioxygenase-like lactoylglutathione lyase family enzyme
MNHPVVVVDDLDAAIAFFVELGLEMGDRRTAEGKWMDRALGLDGVRGEAAFVVAPDGHGRLELTRFDTPAAPPPTSTTPRRTPSGSVSSRSPWTTSTTSSPGCAPTARSSWVRSKTWGTTTGSATSAVLQAS